jgi:AcrR family transcriptional regulator
MLGMSIQKPSTRVRPTRAQTRERLLRAAGTVFAERGYDGASLDDVAVAAGLTKGAVYSSFASKEELFYALIRERIRERLELVTKAADGRATVSDITRDTASALGELMSTQAEWSLLFIEFWARAVRDPGLRDELARERRYARGLIASLLQEQAARGGVELPVPADQLAVAVLALANGIAIEHLADPETVDASTFGVILGLLLEGLTTPDGRRAPESDAPVRLPHAPPPRPSDDKHRPGP